jgi:hypothetical protein
MGATDFDTLHAGKTSQVLMVSIQGGNIGYGINYLQVKDLPALEQSLEGDSTTQRQYVPL